GHGHGKAPWPGRGAIRPQLFLYLHRRPNVRHDRLRRNRATLGVGDGHGTATISRPCRLHQCRCLRPGRQDDGEWRWDTTVLLWDLRGGGSRLRRTKNELAPRDLAMLWEDLAGSATPRAYQAILTLSAAPRSAIPFLNDHLRPVDADPKVEQFIADLDSEDYQVRTAATKQLRNLGDLAEPALRRTLAGNPSAEARRRVEQ